MEKITMNEMVKFAKHYGFIFQGSEIYGGLANTWDYGPLGSRLKNNVKDAWRKKFIQERFNSYELDAGILMHPRVWEASGHVESFSDPLIDCKKCQARHRVDNLINDYDIKANADAMSLEQMQNYINENKLPCPKCQAFDYTEIREFNLMFKTERGASSDSKNIVYLRPENAQGEYVNYLNILRSMRTKLPFSIGQIGKAFRNEITPGNFIFRTIEFEQMELQNFCKPGEDGELYEYFKDFGKSFYNYLGLPNERLRFKDHEKLAHYAIAACDIEYLFPFGWGELCGTHNRGDFDLRNHQEYSGLSMEYLDQETNERFIPYVVEASYGLDRCVLALLFEAYDKETLEDGETRELMRFKPSLAPYKVSVLPLIKKYHNEKAKKVYEMISKNFPSSFDDAGSIGKRYRRQDIIGTPYCITIDDQSLEKDLVTIRDRDTMKQITLKIDEINDYLRQRVSL